MPKGPRGESRPADLIGCAVAVARITIGETEDDAYLVPGRKRSGQAGGRVRADTMSPERRVEIAKKAANSRWENRSSDMSERDSLLSFLFDRTDGIELVNLKFFLGPSRDEDAACAAARRVLEKLWSEPSLESKMPSETAIFLNEPAQEEI